MVITKRYSDGSFWIRIDGGDELEVHPTRWNDPEQRQSIIDGERAASPNRGSHRKSWTRSRGVGRRLR